MTRGQIPRGGIRRAGFKLGADPLGRFPGPQAVRRFPKAAELSRLAAERQMRHDAERVQKAHAADREALRGGQGVRQGQLQHEVGPAADCGRSPGVLCKNGDITPLHEVAAHDAHDCRILSQCRARFGDMPDMPVVNRVIFTNNTGRFQNLSPQLYKIHAPAYNFTKILDILQLKLYNID